MKIEIDTKHDSPEEIKKVIKMLQHLVGEHAYTNSPDMFEGSSEGSSEPANAFASMFGSSSEKESTAKPKKGDSPQLIPY